MPTAGYAYAALSDTLKQDYIYKPSTKYPIMAIVVSLSPELEARLREKAAQQGQDVSLVATQLLETVL
jgi:hypothetical protein